MNNVLASYEKLGLDYLKYRRGLKSDAYIKMLLKHIPKNSLILDVGCGAGEPVDDLLVKAKHEVIGVDLSPTLINHAKRKVIQANYEVGDMRQMKAGMYSVDVVVCLYALFHIPRNEHEIMLKKFASFLPVGGWMLITMGDLPFEGIHMMYGVDSYSSQWGGDKNREIIIRAGFEIIREEMAHSSGERHQIFMAKRIR